MLKEISGKRDNNADELRSIPALIDKVEQSLFVSSKSLLKEANYKGKVVKLTSPKEKIEAKFESGIFLNTKKPNSKHIVGDGSLVCFQQTRKHVISNSEKP